MSRASSGKVVLLTGGTSGFGREAAHELVRRGHHVTVTTRDASRASAAAGAALAEVDLTSEASVQQAVADLLDRHERIDVLINNAGYGQYGAVEDVGEEEAQRQFDANVFGLARMIRAALPSMRAHRSGRIVNVSSVAGRVSTPFAGWYAASKHAVEALSDALRLEVAPFGVDVVLIEPGAFKTRFDEAALSALADVTRNPAYAESAARFREELARAYRRAPGPERVGRLLADVTDARRPRTRYVLPLASGRGVVLARALLGDRAFDRLLASRLT